MGGKETIQKLREINPQIKAVVSSGYSDSSLMSEYQNYGFKGILAKPYTMEQMSQTLQKLA
jgi:DNA-binding NarL/FixJ family response regulator